MTRVSIRSDENLKQQFEAYCDRQGTTMSEELKEHMRECVGDTNTGPLPEEEDLAKSYRHLHRIQSADGRVSVSDAEPQIANRLNIPAKTVRRRVLRHLDERGYINVKVGVITVNVDLDERARDAPSAKPEKVEA